MIPNRYRYALQSGDNIESWETAFAVISLTHCGNLSSDMTSDKLYNMAFVLTSNQTSDMTSDMPFYMTSEMTSDMTSYMTSDIMVLLT